MAESKGLGSLRSPSSLLRKLSYYRLLLTRLCLAKDCKGSNPFFTFKQKTGHSFCYALFFMAESKGFEPSNRFRRLHDFQSCSFDQLGQLSIDQMTRNIIYDFIQKSKQIFSYYSKFTLSEQHALPTPAGELDVRKACCSLSVHNRRYTAALHRHTPGIVQSNPLQCNPTVCLWECGGISVGHNTGS